MALVIKCCFTVLFATFIYHSECQRFAGRQAPSQTSSGGRDFYAILGVPRDADDRIIKKAYRKLAKAHHPDSNRNKPSESSQKFVDIADAHDVLTDPQKRELYDQYGEEGLDPNFRQGFPFGHPGGQRTFVYRSADSNNFFFGSGMDSFIFDGFNEFWDPHQGSFSQNQYIYKGTSVDEIQSFRQWKDLFEDQQQNWATVVNFYNPSCRPCIGLKADYVSVADMLKSIISITSVNCGAHKDICESQKIDEFPSIRIYFHKEKSKTFIRYPRSQPREASAIVHWVSQTLPSAVVKLTVTNVEDWLTANSTIPKAVLFTAKQNVPLIFKSVSMQLEGRISLGVVFKSDAKMSAVFRPRNYPSLLHVVDIDNLAGVWSDLSHSAEALYMRLTDIITQKKKRSGPYSIRGCNELTSRAYNAGACNREDSNRCIVLVKFADTDVEKAAMKAITGVAEAYSNEPIKFYWIDGSRQKKFLSSFGITCQSKSCSPAIIGFSPKRRKYAVVQDGPAATTSESISKFVERIIESGGTALDKVVGEIKAVDDSGRSALADLVRSRSFQVDEL